MGIKKTIATIITAGALAVPLLAFAPVPNTTTYGHDYLFPEDGSSVVVHAAGKRYEVAEMPATDIKNVGKVHYRYHGVIAILNAKGKIVFYRAMKEAKAVNAYGGFLEHKRHTYKSLADLEHVVKHDIHTAYNGY